MAYNGKLPGKDEVASLLINALRQDKTDVAINAEIQAEIDQPSFKAAEEKLERLSKPQEVELDTSKAERKLKKLLKPLKEVQSTIKEISNSGGNFNITHNTIKTYENFKMTVSELSREIAESNEELLEAQKIIRDVDKTISGLDMKVEKAPKRKRKPKAKASDSGDVAAVKKETQANKELEQSIENVEKARNKSKTSKPKVDEVGAINTQIKANENLAKSHEKVEKSAKEAYLASKKVYQVVGGELPNEGKGSILYPNRELAEKHANNTNGLLGAGTVQVIEKAYSELGEEAREAFEKAFYSEPENKKVVNRNIPLSAKDIDTYLALIEGREDFDNQYKRLSAARSKGAGSANIKLSYIIRDSLEMILEEDQYISDDEVELLERILQRRRSNEDLLKEYMSAPKVEQTPIIESSEKKIEGNKELAASYDQVGEAAQAAGEKEQKRAKSLDMKKVIERFNGIMRLSGYDHHTIGTDFSEGTENWGLKEMIDEAEYVLSTYYEDGHINEMLKQDDYKDWRSQTEKFKRFIAAYKPYIEVVNEQTDALKENTKAAEENEDTQSKIAQTPSQRASKDPLAARNKATEKAIEQQNELADAVKRLNELSQDPWDIKSEEEVNRIYRERIDIFNKLDEQKFRDYNEDEYFGALSLNESYQNRLVGFKEEKDDKIYDEIDEKYAYDNQILYTSAELESMLENRKKLMKDITFIETESYEDAQEYNKKIEQRLALMKELEPLYESGKISKTDLEDIVFEKGTLEERTSLLDAIQGSVMRDASDDFSSWEDLLGEAQLYLKDYEKILVTTASGKKLEIGPDMSMEDYRAFLRMNVDKAKSVEFVRKKIEVQTDAIEDNTRAAKENVLNELRSLDNKTKTTDNTVELAKMLVTRKQIVEVAGDARILNDEELQSQRAINEELKKRIDLQRIATNIVYHAGDLSDHNNTMKSLPLGNVAPSRNVGNVFNGLTGLYTTENVDGFWANEWDGAPISSIDLSHYKMFDARDNDLAKKAQQFFGDLNSTIYGYHRFFDFESGEMKESTDVKTVEALYDDFKAVFKGIDLDFESFKDFITRSRAIVEGHKFEEVEVPDIDMGVAKSNAGTVLQGVSQDVFNSDSFQTQLLKMLGFEGIDLRGTKFNGTYTGGTVVFDVKPESIKTVNEKWSDVMARNGYEIDDAALAREEKRRELAFETAKAYSKQAEEQEKGKKSLEEFIQLYQELLNKSDDKTEFGKRNASLLESVTSQDNPMDVNAAYDKLIANEQEYQAAQEERARVAAEAARQEEEKQKKIAEWNIQAQEFVRRSQELMPAGGFAEGSKEIQVYYDLMNQLTKGMLNADEAMERLRKSLDATNDEMREANNIGYHAGDLGKAEHYGNFAGSNRGTGHFGTGTYFVGDPKAIEGYNSRNGVPAPIEQVDFSKYNLFKPEDTEEAYELHRVLKMINDDLIYMHKYDDIDLDFLTQAYEDDNKEPVLDFLNKYLTESARSHYESEALAYKDYLENLDESKIRDEVERAYSSTIKDIMDLGEELPDDWLIEEDIIEDAVKERLAEIKKALENFDINQEMAKRVIYDIEHGKFESVLEMQELKDVLVNRLSQIFVGKTREELSDALDETFKTISQYPESKYYEVDNASTVFMKQLGYEGVDVRHTELDNTEYGSVIYDLKGEDLARRQEILNVEKQTTEEKKEQLSIDEIMSQGMKARIDRANELSKAGISVNRGTLLPDTDEAFNVALNGGAKKDIQKATLQKIEQGLESMQIDFSGVPEDKMGEHAVRVFNGVLSDIGYNLSNKAWRNLNKKDYDGPRDGWYHFQTEDQSGRNSGVGTTKKMYGSFSNISKLTPDLMSALLSELAEKGFKGNIKIADDWLGYQDTDQIVGHANDDASFRILNDVFNKYLSDGIFDRIGSGLDVKFKSKEKQSFTNLLSDIYGAAPGETFTAQEINDIISKMATDGNKTMSKADLYNNIISPILQQRSPDVSESTKWIDELRTKADALGDEFKDSQQYKDFFAAIENGSISATDAVHKLEQAFEDFNVGKIGNVDQNGQLSLLPDNIDENEYKKLTKGTGIKAFLNGLNIPKDKIAEIEKELVGLFKAELGGTDTTAALEQLVQKMLELGSETRETHNIYERFYEDFKNKKIIFDDEMQAQFDPEEWAYIRQHNPHNLVHDNDRLKYPDAMSIDSWAEQLRTYGLEAFDGIDDDKTLFKVFFEELAKARTASKQPKRERANLSDLYDSSEREDYIYTGIADIFGQMYINTEKSKNAINEETGALKGLEGQAEKAAGAKKKVSKANKELGTEAVNSAGEIGKETEALEDLEEQANKVWTTPRQGGSIEGLNLPTQFVGEDGQSVVQMFAKIKDELEEVTGSPVKIDFVSEVNKDGELEAVGATLEYVNKESGVTIKQFYDIAKGEDDVITATQTAEKATIKATKAQKEFNAELKKQLALEQINTLKKQMGEFPVDLTAVYAAANKIVDKDSFDEFNLQLKIAQESLRGMKAEMKGQNTLDPIVAAEKRLKSLGSELDSLKNKFVLITGTGVDTKWIDGKTKSIMDLYDKFNKETDAEKKTGYYKQIIEELDKADSGMTNLNELIRIQNKLFKDRKALSKMDKDTQSYRIAEENVRLQGIELSNLIRNSEHRETIMKRAIQFEKELAAAAQDRMDKQDKKFNSRYGGSTLLASGDWDGATEQKEAMKKFAEATFGGELAIKGFNKAGTEMYITLRDSEGALNEVTVALDKGSKKIKAFETGSNGIADAFKQLGKGAMSYVKQFASMYLGMHDFIRYAQQGVQIVRDIDLAMTELRKVTDETEATYAKFLDTASKSAGAIGSTVKDFTTVTSDFARLGYSIEEASELAKTALIYENVGDGFNSVEEASESIISTMKAFGIEAEGTMGIVDRFNAVGNNFAITSKGIGDALQRSASALVEGGNSIDEAIGIITAANSVIQNPEQVGTAMKTLSLRLRSTKIELEEMGEDAEGAATSVASLRAKLLGLTSGKVDIMADATTFKNTTQILREMAAVWDEMDDISKAGALELMGGKRQANILSSIIANFDTVEDVIKTSANSAGSALEENRKYIESIQGHIDVLTNSWQTMWNNALNSDLVKFFIDLANMLVQIVDKVGLLQVAFGAIASILAFKSFNGEEVGLFAALLQKIPVVNTLLTAFNGKLAAIEITGKAAETATGLFGSALVGAATLGIALAIPLVIKLGDAFIQTKKEIREAAKEAEDAIKTIKTEIDSTEDVVKNSAKRFAELSQGIDQMSGKNVSLTTDEYEEFLNLSNQLADTFPTLTRIYDENGNAIVQLGGDTNTVVDSLYNLLEVERQLANQKIADELPDLFKGIKLDSDEYGRELNELKKQKSENEAILEYLNGDGSNFINQLLRSSTSTVGKNDGFANVRKQLLDELGLGYSTWNRGSDVIYKLDASVTDEDIAKAKDHIALAFSEVSKEYAKNIDSLSSEIQTTVNKNKANWSGVLSSISAWLTTDESYQVLNDDMQTVVKSMINNIDFSSMEDIKTWDDMQQYIKDKIITKMQSATPEVQKAFSEMFAIDDDQSMKQYKNEIQEKAKEIETLSKGAFKADEVLQSTGYKDILGQYETYANDVIRILDDNLDEQELNKIKAKIYSLSPDEISKALSIVKNYGVDTWESLKEAIENKTFDVAIDFDVEVAGLESLQTALEETVSAGGLSAEAVGNIKSRYQDLDSYDPATLFEETANGIHLNVQAARELEAEYEKLNKEALDNKLDGLVEQYDNLSEEIANTSDAYKRAELYSNRSNILKQITDTATLAARYEGLTSAYNKWQKAQAGPEERDMYEGILEGKKVVDEEIARGWLDAGTREYIELLSGKDLSTASFNEILEIYKKLNETIDGTKYNVYDFFTKDADDNATVDGIYNFFDAVMAVQEKGKEWVKQNEDGSLSFDFNVNGGEEAVAEALGVSEELVQIILRAAADAGFDINLESAYTDLANLKDEATAANDKLKELGATDYTFNINSTDIYDVNKQIEKAKETLDKFKNTDGTIDVEAEGAKEAQTLLATLIYQKQTLDDAIILKMDVENPDTELERVVKKLQDFKAAYNKLEVALAIGEDTTEANKEVQSAISALQAESPSVRATLGIDLLQSHEEINKQIGNITPEMLLKVDPDTTLVDEYKAAEHTTEGELVWHNNLKEVTDWINDPTKDKKATGYVTWYSDTSKLGTPTGGGAVANGTAHARGTAFARGNWGAPKSEAALVGELGPEMVVRGNQWFTVGENGAEFTDVKKGDIIFNHKQTEELLSNGHINGRGKAYASGTAYAFVRDAGVGAKLTAEKEYIRARAEYVKAKQEADDNSARALNAKDDYEKAKQELVKANDNLYTNNNGAYKAYGASGYKAHNDIYGSSGSGPGKTAIKELRNAGVSAGATVAEEAKQLVDFVETKLENIEATISKTTAYLNNYVDDTSAEGDKLAQYNKLVSEEKKKKNTYSDAESYYSKKAEELLKKVNSKYREMAQNGAIAIEDFIGDKEGKQAEAIQEYREMVNKANEAKVAELESIARIEEIRLEQFNDLADDYDNVISLITAESDLINAHMDLQEAKGERLSENYYKELIKNTNETIDELEDKRARMQKDLADAVSSGEIEKGTDTWYEMVNAIIDVDEELIQCEIDVEEFQNAINDLRWDNLDKLIDRFDALDSELSHIYDRFTDDDNVVDDDGNWKDNGIAALGVAAEKMELAQAKAKQYKKAIVDLKKHWRAWGYSQDEYNEKLDELIEKQWESIEAYEDTKDNIVDLNKIRIDAVKNAIKKEIDAYKKLIDKKKEALDADKDLYDFEKNIAEQQKDIATIQRKLAALAGDNSTAAAAQRKQLEAELAEKESELADTYRDRSVEDQKTALDKESEYFEETKNAEMEALDKWLTDEEKVVSESFNTVKNNADTVLNQINGISNQYGISISGSITKPWKDGSNAIDSYKAKFSELSSSFTEMVNEIVAQQKRLQEAANKSANNALASALNAVNSAKNSGSGGSSGSGGGSKGSSGGGGGGGGSYGYTWSPYAGGPVYTNGESGWGNNTDKTIDFVGDNAMDVSKVTQVLNRGDTGTDVKALQISLQKQGYNVSVDGSFGPETEAAVKQYQQDNGLAQDGKVGPATKAEFKKDGYAKGTLGVGESDWAWIDEVGEELVLHADGSGKLSYLTKGSSVIPADLTKKLMELAVDPTQTLEASRPVISAPQITNNEINISMDIAEVVHIDTVTNDTLHDLTKTVEKQLDKYMKNLNNQIRKYTR